MRAFLLLFLFYIVAAQTLQSQVAPETNLEVLAQSYFKQGEYEKARGVYEELMKRNRYASQYYESYLLCLVKLEDWKEAVKFTQKQSRQFPDNPTLKVDYVWTLEKSGENKKADQFIEDLLQDKVILNSGRSPMLAQALQKRGYNKQAIQVYLNARKHAGNPMAFTMELADLYANAGNFTAVFDEYLQYIEWNPSYHEMVKQRLQLFLTEDVYYDQLKIAIVNRLQKNPSNDGYIELLYWTFVQQKDWEGAFVQMKALDIRTGRTGARLLELADLCLENQVFGVAIKCYQYLRSQGKEAPYYHQAETGYLRTKFNKLKEEGTEQAEELLALEKEYLTFIEERGLLAGAAKARYDLAQFYLFVMAKPAAAIIQLNDYLQSSISKTEKGKAKLLLAHAYLVNGDEWEAHLLYKQLEKEFKDDIIGQEARFNYAKLCYFRGEFDWALTQLEVLKGATTQLISNNAIELALHIIETTGLDSTETALALFAAAEFRVLKNDFTGAKALLDTLQKQFSYHELSDNILLLKANIAVKTKNYTEAIRLFSELVEKYKYELLADDAMIALARLYDFTLKDTDNAIRFYERLLMEYPGSIYSFEARNRFRFLRGDKAAQ